MNTCPKCGHSWPDDKRAKGGKARWRGTTKVQRKQAASDAAKARWANHLKVKAATPREPCKRVQRSVLSPHVGRCLLLQPPKKSPALRFRRNNRKPQTEKSKSQTNNKSPTTTNGSGSRIDWIDAPGRQRIDLQKSAAGVCRRGEKLFDYVSTSGTADHPEPHDLGVRQVRHRHGHPIARQSRSMRSF